MFLDNIMAIQTPSVIDAAIAKYSGGDDAYANKLKTTIRDAMGYSNYISRIGKETSAPAEIGSVEGLSPAGVRNKIGSKFNQQKENVNTLSQIAGGIDTAADSIASKLAAKSREADKNRFDSSFVFDPRDELDQKILDYTRNPFNDDGSVKSLQQFEAELNQEFGSNINFDEESGTVATGRSGGGFNSSQIKERIVERLPNDYIGKERAYTYRFQGMTEKQAAEEQMIDYANMIVAGRGKEVPQELYPMAYSLLSDAEKSKLRGFSSGRDL